MLHHNGKMSDLQSNSHAKKRYGENSLKGTPTIQQSCQEKIEDLTQIKRNMEIKSSPSLIYVPIEA